MPLLQKCGVLTIIHPQIPLVEIWGCGLSCCHVSVFVTIFQKCARPKVRPYLDTEKRALQLYYGTFPNWAIIYPYFVALKFCEVLKKRNFLRQKNFFAQKLPF